MNKRITTAFRPPTRVAGCTAAKNPPQEASHASA